MERPMPYSTLKEIPKRVQDVLPKEAEIIFKEAYNNALKYYKDPKKRRGNATLEETANRIAWSAVKKKYTKQGDRWVKKQKN